MSLVIKSRLNMVDLLSHGLRASDGFDAICVQNLQDRYQIDSLEPFSLDFI